MSPENESPGHHGKDGHTRVNMLWPDELKEQVREQVGQRGLTGFTLDAVRSKLSNQPSVDELTEARELAQRLADLIVVSEEDYHQLVEVLRERGLPSWFNTVGWPTVLVEMIAGSLEEYRPGELGEDELPWGQEPRGMDTVELPGDVQNGVPNTIPDKATKEDLFERIQRQGKELGIDLRPASQVRKQARPSITVPVAPPPEPSLEPAGPKPDACPNCGSIRVDGECWECDL